MDEITTYNEHILTWQTSWLQSLNLINLVYDQIESSATNLAEALNTTVHDIDSINNMLEKIVISNNIIINTSVEGKENITNNSSHGLADIINNPIGNPYLSLLLSNVQNQSGIEHADISGDFFKMAFNKTGKSLIESLVNDEKFTGLLARNLSEGLGENAGGLIGDIFASSLADVGAGEIATTSIEALAEAAGAFLAPEISIPILIAGALWSLFRGNKKLKPSISDNKGFKPWVPTPEDEALMQQGHLPVNKKQELPPYTPPALDLHKLVPAVAADNLRRDKTFEAVYPYIVDPGLAKRNEVIRIFKQRGLPEAMAPGLDKQLKNIQDEIPGGSQIPANVLLRSFIYSKYERNGANQDAARSVTININKALIEHFTVNVKEVKESYDTIKNEVEKTILDVLHYEKLIK